MTITAVENLRERPGRVGRQYPARDLTRAVTAPAPYVDRDPAMMGNRLTPARLTAVLLERNGGARQSWVDLADEARRHDPHLHSQLQLREDSVAETEFEIVAPDGADQRGRRRQAKRAVGACRELAQGWKRAAGGGLHTWLKELVGAKYYGLGAHEVLWERGPDALTRPVVLVRVAERRLSYACDPRDPDPWRPRVWDPDDATSPFHGGYGVPLDAFHPDKFVVHAPRVVGGPPTAEGMFATLVWFWLFRTWAWRDLMALNEMIGRPPVIGYFSAGGARQGRENEFNAGGRAATDAEIAAGRKAVNGLTGALRAMLPDTVRLEALRYSTPDNPIQLLTSQECDRQTSKVVSGTTALSDVVAGARASHEVGERTAQTPWRSDCRDADWVIGWLFERFVRANPDYFGADCPVPLSRAKTDPPKDRRAVLEAIEKGQAVGMKIPRAWAHREACIPEPEEGRGGQVEDVLEPRAAAPAPRQLPPGSADEAGRDPVASDTPDTPDGRQE